MSHEQAVRVAAGCLEVAPRENGYVVVFRGDGHRTYYTWRPMKSRAETARDAVVQQLAMVLEGWELHQGGLNA